MRITGMSTLAKLSRCDPLGVRQFQIISWFDTRRSLVSHPEYRVPRFPIGRLRAHRGSFQTYHNLLEIRSGSAAPRSLTRIVGARRPRCVVRATHLLNPELDGVAVHVSKRLHIDVGVRTLLRVDFRC